MNMDGHLHMPRKTSHLSAVSAVLLVLTCPHVRATEDIRISASAHKTDLRLGEPLFLQGVIEVTAKGPVLVVYQNAPTYAPSPRARAYVNISRDGLKFDYWHDGMRPLLMRRPSARRVEDTVTNQFTVAYFRTRGLAFPESGVYHVSTSCVIKSGPTIRADAVKIEVRPGNATDREAWKILSDLGDVYGHLIQAPWVQEALTDDHVEIFDNFLGEFPESVYAQYVNLSLGRFFMGGKRGDKARAEAYLKRASAPEVDPTVRRKALAHLAELENERMRR